jgi:hypothetical protein
VHQYAILATARAAQTGNARLCPPVLGYCTGGLGLRYQTVPARYLGLLHGQLMLKNYQASCAGMPPSKTTACSGLLRRRLTLRVPGVRTTDATTLMRPDGVATGTTMGPVTFLSPQYLFSTLCSR